MRLIWRSIRIGIIFFLPSAIPEWLLHSPITKNKRTPMQNALVSFRFIDRARHLKKQKRRICRKYLPLRLLWQRLGIIYSNRLFGTYMCVGVCSIFICQICFYNHAHLRLLKDISMHNITIAQNISQVLLVKYSVFPLSKV